MDIEVSLFNPSTLELSSLNEFPQGLNTLIGETKRNLLNASQKDRKQEIRSILYYMQAKLFLLTTEIADKSLDVKYYAPIRGNQLAIAFMQRDLETFPLEKVIIAEKFMKKFWARCNCRDKCPLRASYEESWRIYESLAKINNADKAKLVDGVQINCRKTLMDLHILRS